ncbi:unnamed protein product [Gongylonema pulchrum]|uniref:Uncharacterized protein n=1 Tax=Gongylonema pulchrum TaxID=637853 RepID=A0A3P6QDV6_9BILA|nr:unnamed protein product [Gongylonema pulchrum]
MLFSNKLLPAAMTVYSRRIYIANAKNNTIEQYSGGSLQVGTVVCQGMVVVAVSAYHWAMACCLTLPSDASVTIILRLITPLKFAHEFISAPKHFMLLAVRGRFIRFTFKQVANNILWNEDPYSMLSVQSVGAPVSVGVDLFSPNRAIYWIDSYDDKVIKRSSDLSPTTIFLSRRSNCAALFHLAVDEVGRQLFVSCAEYGLNHASSIHVWRIKNNDHLEYIGVVVSGRERSPVTDRPPLPRQIALFSRLNLLFYVDDSGPSPVIIRCSLDGRQCIQWEAPNLTHNVKLHAYQLNDRLYYTAANGLYLLI